MRRAFLLFLLSLIGCSSPKSAEPLVSEPLTVVAERLPLQESYVRERQFTGLVVARRNSQVGFLRAGRVDQLLVDEGERVTTGQLLARLDQRSLERQQQQLIARQKENQAILDEYEAGARKDELKAAAAAVHQLNERLRLARLKNERRQQLFEQGAVAREELDEASTEVRALRAELGQARSRYDDLKAGTRSETMRAQRARLEQVRADQASLAVSFADSRLEAPYAAVVQRRLVDEGSFVNPGEPVFELVEADSLEAEIGVPVTYLGPFRPGQTHQLVVEGRSYKAVVSRILPQVEPSSRTITVVFDFFTGSRGRVKSGQTARLTVAEPVDQSGIWLPNSALVKDARGLFGCFSLVSQESHFLVERHSVEVLHTDGDRSYVRGTLTGDQPVIIAGAHRVTAGQKVLWP